MCPPRSLWLNKCSLRTWESKNEENKGPNEKKTKISESKKVRSVIAIVSKAFDYGLNTKRKEAAQLACLVWNSGTPSISKLGHVISKEMKSGLPPNRGAWLVFDCDEMQRVPGAPRHATFFCLFVKTEEEDCNQPVECLPCVLLIHPFWRRREWKRSGLRRNEQV